MIGKVIPLQATNHLVVAELRVRLEGMASILRAIDAGELLAALPDCPVASANHAAALTLLTVVENEVHSLCRDLAGEKH